ncbi:uncharacterized protein LOC106657156 [Trichogramma pretiosum]|uniref:uncharacterized protein LOC106657156 n=1 Tax=Trichogramma pretiosum TaxID=7493 RepID=UPI0006C96130|nr:uncharacterized protein LOC106657156 [Trichogramma pretiosum]
MYLDKFELSGSAVSNAMMLAATLLFLLAAIAVDGCPTTESRYSIRYDLIKRDVKSSESIITRRWVADVDKCRNFAESKQALAFNFVARSTAAGRSSANCFPLRCPEIDGERRLLNATGWDYYSAYPIGAGTNESFTGNGTVSCVERVGLFALFTEEQNITDARETCRAATPLGGYLADVTSEPRTRGISKLIGDLLVYIGLTNDAQQRRWRNELDDYLWCFDYRAWDVGEPSHSRGCVALFRQNPKTDPVWRVVACSNRLPFVCELPRTAGKKAYSYVNFLRSKDVIS